MQRLEDHLMNVCNYSILMGKEIGLNRKQLFDLAAASRFHDIGKYKIAKNILYKQGKLTNIEFEIMKKHPIYSIDLVKEKNFNNEITKAILHHHERYDGKGYNSGLKGEEIPYLARIISIADTYDAITSNRSYSLAKSHEYAVGEILANSGTQFDPDLVYVFKTSIKSKFALTIMEKII